MENHAYAHSLMIVHASKLIAETNKFGTNQKKKTAAPALNVGKAKCFRMEDVKNARKASSSSKVNANAQRPAMQQVPSHTSTKKIVNASALGQVTATRALSSAISTQ
jgi:hypothetical protein